MDDAPERRRITTYDKVYHTDLLRESPVYVTDNAFPPGLFQQIKREALLLEHKMHTKYSRSGRHGFWTSLSHEERNRNTEGHILTTRSPRRFAIEQVGMQHGMHAPNTCRT